MRRRVQHHAHDAVLQQDVVLLAPRAFGPPMVLAPISIVNVGGVGSVHM